MFVGSGDSAAIGGPSILGGSGGAAGIPGALAAGAGGGPVGLPGLAGGAAGSDAKITPLTQQQMQQALLYLIRVFT